MLLNLLHQLREGLSLRRRAGRRQRLLDEARRLAAGGSFRAVLESVEVWLAENPHDPDAMQLAGLAHFSLGENEAAAGYLERAVALGSDGAVLRANLAEVLRRLGRFAEAEDHLDRALGIDPEFAVAHLNRAVLLAERSRRGDAIEAARRAVALDPDSGRARLVLGTMLLTKSEAEEALPHLELAAQLDPDNVAVRYQLERARRILCLWPRWPQDGCEIVERAAAGRWHPGTDGIPPFFAHEYPVSNEMRRRCAQNFADWILERAGHRAGRPEAPPAGERLRIGYLSSDFHDHPTMHLAAGLFPRHDRRRFEVWAYSMGAPDGSRYLDRLRGDVEHFVDVRELSSRGVLERIRNDGIQILVDMKGFTFGARPEILAWRAAPVQVQFLGYPGTMGCGLVDYLVSDRIVTPPGSERWYGEQLALMPGSYQVNDRDQAIGQAPSRRECGLPEGGFVFCCFNATYKFDPETFDAWMRMLHHVPDSVLWLLAGKNPGAIEALRDRARTAGIDPQRLVFAPFAPKAAHLGRLSHADLVLDTRLVNAHTGASDALWAGVPVLTIGGDSFPSRVAASLLHAAGLPELAVDSIEAYERVALELATDRARLAGLRTRLRESRLHCSLFDTDLWVASLERAYEIMWNRYRDVGDAGSFSVLHPAVRPVRTCGSSPAPSH